MMQDPNRYYQELWTSVIPRLPGTPPQGRRVQVRPGVPNQNSRLGPPAGRATGVTRRHSSQMGISREGAEALSDEEGGLWLRAYRSAEGGAPTVGIGHKVRPGDNIRRGDRISRQRATQFFLDDIASAQRRARALLGNLPVTQHEFDALVDLMFNVAPEALTPTASPRLHGAVRAGDYAEIGNQLRYTRDRGGGTPQGLVYRSDRRQNIYRHGNYANTRPRP